MLRFLAAIAAFALALAPCVAHADDDRSLAGVEVHIDSSEPVVLERRVAPPPDRPWADAWEAACTSPCDARLPVDATYRINGEGVRSSSRFRLTPVAGDRVVLRVDAGHTTTVTVGVIAILGGVALTLAGAAIAFVDSVTDTCADAGRPADIAACEQVNRSGHHGLTATDGEIMAAAGLAVIATAAIVMAATKTQVDRRPKRPPPRMTYVRSPEHGSAGWRPPHATLAAPLFSVTF